MIDGDEILCCVEEERIQVLAIGSETSIGFHIKVLTISLYM
jgi:hypothetical protein